VTLFLEFLDRRHRESKRKLRLVKKLLEQGDVNVVSHLDDDEPFLYVKSPENGSNFGGIRIYEIGGVIAYKIQRTEDAHPYGDAYLLDLEEMFHDYMTETDSEQKAGKKVIKSAIREIKRFFEKSTEAESVLLNKEPDPKVIMKTGGTDYASMLLSRM
jgi:hypothetical protein